MPTLTVDRFEIGIDRRKGRLASDANRLWDATNVYINNGRHIRKRPGMSYVGSFNGTSKGLFSAKGYLNAYLKDPASPTSPAVIGAGPLREVYATYASGAAIDKVYFASNFGGALFVMFQTTGGDFISCYDASATPDDILETEITDVNCPTVGTNLQNPCGIQMTSRIYLGDDASVGYSAVDNPTDWTAVGDAGAINAAREALGSQEVKALGQYQGVLIIFFEDSAQAWAVDPDPSFIALNQSIDGVGCRYPLSVANLSSDVFFLAKQGFKSISLLSLTNNLADVDVGTPIEPLVQVSLDGLSGDPVAIYNPRGQYMCAIGNDVYVYSFSRTAKISAWSSYDFNMPVDYWASHEGEVYFRSGDDVYQLDVTQTQDEDPIGGFSNFTASVEMAYLDMKKPASLKYVHSCDIIQEGECDVRFRYQYVDSNGVTQEAVTDYITGVGSNTRPGGLVPVELSVTAIAPEFRNSTDSAWELHGISLHYEEIGLL